MLDGDTSKRNLYALLGARRMALAVVGVLVIGVFLLLMLAAGRAIVRTSERLSMAPPACGGLEAMSCAR